MGEPHTSFHQAALKIVWAENLIKNLERLIVEETEAAPKQAIMQFNQRSGNYGIKVGLFGGVPESVILMAGDVVSNLRASLDYCWMGLVRAEDPAGPKKTLPIATNRKGVISTIDKASIGGATAKAKTLLGDTIKSHRDFADGGNRPLVALNELSNWNKHNLLILQRVKTRINNVTFGNNIRIGYIEATGDMRRTIGIGPTFASNFRHEGDAMTEIVFGQHELVKHEPVIPTLRNFAKVCRHAVEAFCAAFPSPQNPTFT